MKILGTPGNKLTGTRMNYSPQGGWSTTYIFVCDSAAEAVALAQSQASAFTSVVASVEKPPYTVEVTASRADGGSPDTDYSDKWEITPIDADLSYKEHPKFQDLDGSGSGAAAPLQEALIAFEKNPEGSETDYYTTYQTVSGSANAVSFLELLKRGSDHYQNFSTGLRFTRTVSDGFTALGNTFSSVGKLWTTAQIIAAYGPPALYQAAMSGAETALQAPAAGYYGGWLKKQPSITQRGALRSDIVTEWTLANWSTFLYPGA